MMKFEHYDCRDRCCIRWAVACTIFVAIAALCGCRTGGTDVSNLSDIVDQVLTAIEQRSNGDDEAPPPEMAKALDFVRENGSPNPVPDDFSGVNWIDTDVTDWEQSATLWSVTVSGSLITLDYDKAGVWPVAKPVGDDLLNANAWIFIFDDGEWYAGTWEWMRPGQKTKESKAVSGGGHVRSKRFKDWKPVSGTWYGGMVSGLARSGVRNVEERSNVFMFRWP